MKPLDELELASSINAATIDIFDTMLSMSVSPETVENDGGIDGRRIVGAVSFAGDVMGSVRVYLGDAFARLVTAAMMGMEEEEVDDDEVVDVVGEVCNMIGGDLKSRLCDLGLPCQLSIPTTTRGSDFVISTMGWTRQERYGFRHDDDLAIVEITMKAGG